MADGRRTWVLAGLLLAVSVTSCLGDQTTPGTGAGSSDTPPSGAQGLAGASANTTIAIQGCTGYSVQAHVPWDAVAQAVPEGFAPMPFNGPGGDPVYEGRRAQAFFDGFRCQTVTAGEASFSEVTILLPKVEVVPPADLAPGGDQRSYIPLFASTDTARVAQALAAWGWLAEQDQPTVETLGTEPTPTGHVEGSAGGTTMEIFATVAHTPGTTSTFEGSRSRYFLTEPPLFQGEDPQVTGLIDRSTTNATGSFGDGTFRLDGGPLGQALGPGGDGFGFDAQDDSWGERLAYRPLDASR